MMHFLKILLADSSDVEPAGRLLLDVASPTYSMLDKMRSTWPCFDVIDLSKKKVIEMQKNYLKKIVW